MSLHLIAPVADEPVTLAEAKALLRIDGNDLDTDLTAALEAARAEAEHFAGRSFAPQTWRLSRDDWWAGGLFLPMSPVESVESVEYLDTAGNWQTIAPSNYLLDGDHLHFDLAFDLPRVLSRDDAIRVEYTTGTWHADSNGSNLPTAIKRAITMLAQSTFDSLAEQPQTLRDRAFALLRPYRHDTGLRAA